MSILLLLLFYRGPGSLKEKIIPGCWVLAVGGWLLGVGHWLLAVGGWLLAFGCWLLAVGYLLLGVGCWLLAVGFWVLAVGCWHRQTGNRQPGAKRYSIRSGGSNKTTTTPHLTPSTPEPATRSSLLRGKNLVVQRPIPFETARAPTWHLIL